jgi:hypothetical protein
LHLVLAKNWKMLYMGYELVIISLRHHYPSVQIYTALANYIISTS